MGVRTLYLCSIGLVACVGPETLPEELSVGMWVNARGPTDAEGEIVNRVTQLERQDSDAAVKVEITAALDADATESELFVLRQNVKIGANTIFENLEPNDTSPFPLKAGDWLKIKARIRNDGGLRSREIRKIKARKNFAIEGLIEDFDRRSGSLQIGSVPLQLATDARIETLPQHGSVARGDPLAVFNEDDQKSVPFTLRPFDGVYLGGQIKFQGVFTDEFDLDRTRDRDQSKLRETAKLDLLWTLDDDKSFVLIEGNYRHNNRLRDDRANTRDDNASLSRAYVYLHVAEWLRIQVGRQDFDDEREWLYDEVLDGFRLRSSYQALDLEVSASQGREILHRSDGIDDTALYAAVLRYHLNDDHHIATYVLKRVDSNPTDFEPLLIGLRSYSKPWKGIGHWAELALASGKDGSKSIRGSAVDLGLLYRFDYSWRPTIVAGYAFGSGKDDASRHSGFRQTGLQDNNAKFGGVTSLKYYGEVLEPELANLEVTTLGIGIRPYRSFSVDVLWHGYRMDVAKFSLEDSKIKAMANGFSRDLGWGIDLVAGYRYRDWISAELVAGYFVPGRAFDRADEAGMLAVQIRLNF